MGREIQAEASIPQDIHPDRLGARAGGEIVTGQDREAKSCMGSDHKCLVDGLGGGTAAGQCHMKNPPALASAFASAHSQSFERPSAGHSHPTAQAQKVRKEVCMYPQRNTRDIWCWMDRCRCACRLDDDDRLTQFLIAFA